MSHANIGDVSRPYLTRPDYLVVPEEVGVDLMVWMASREIGLRVYRLQTHQVHQMPDALGVHSIALAAQERRHTTSAIKKEAVLSGEVKGADKSRGRRYHHSEGGHGHNHECRNKGERYSN